MAAFHTDHGRKPSFMMQFINLPVGKGNFHPVPVAEGNGIQGINFTVCPGKGIFFITITPDGKKLYIHSAFSETGNIGMGFACHVPVDIYSAVITDGGKNIIVGVNEQGAHMKFPQVLGIGGHAIQYQETGKKN